MPRDLCVCCRYIRCNFSSDHLLLSLAYVLRVRELKPVMGVMGLKTRNLFLQSGGDSFEFLSFSLAFSSESLGSACPSTQLHRAVTLFVMRAMVFEPHLAPDKLKLETGHCGNGELILSALPHPNVAQIRTQKQHAVRISNPKSRKRTHPIPRCPMGFKL